MAQFHPNKELNEVIEYAVSLGVEVHVVKRSCSRAIVVSARRTRRLPLVGMVDAKKLGRACPLVATAN
jgi:predicted type IV restriction endonuclease